MRVAAVILAAGASRRLGEAKQLVRVGRERLLERALRVAEEAGCAPILVVLGARTEEIQAACDLGRASVAINVDWAEGMASSIRTGIAALEASGVNVDAAIVTGCDQPALTAEHLRALMGGGVAASEYAGRRGIPACFPVDAFGALKGLSGDKGARDLLQEASVTAGEMPDGELDVDTVEALAEARARYG